MSTFKDSKVYNVNDFINWYKDDLLVVSPKYQRNKVWNTKAKSYLIDTIIRGLPVPQIFLRQITDVNTMRTNREIIDGQQRLTAIIEFLNDEFQINRTHNSDFGGYTYSRLPEEIKEDILDFEFSVEIIKSKDDGVIYDMFSRVNTNNVTANSQELRNARYWGEFKVFAYKEAKEWRQFFSENKIFKDGNFARMNDVEFVSLLIIQLIDGITYDSPSEVEKYYKKYDEYFDIVDVIESKMFQIRSIIFNIFDDEIFRTKLFLNKNYFYSLFTIINNELFGIEELNDCLKVTSEAYKTSIVSQLRRTIVSFESKYGEFKNETIYDSAVLKDFETIMKLHKSRTTNKIERITRISLMYKYL